MPVNRLSSRSVVLRGLLTTTALVTAGGGLSEAQAACYTGPYPYTNAGSIACIVVANTSFTGDLSNTGTISPSGIAVTGSTITGSILSGGTTIGGISVDASSRINSSGPAISITGATLLGGISNAGVLTAASSVIYVSGVSTFAGGITNSGSISAPGNPFAIGISVFNVSGFSGGIANSGSITSQSNYGISVQNTTNFAGGVSNSGSITSGSTGLYVSVSTFAGGITNSGTIAAINTSRSVYGIDVAGFSTFSGGIVNTGTISSSGWGIYLAGSNFSGGIVNSGSITSRSTGIYAGAGTFAGGITNSGTITATVTSHPVYGINVFASNFSGGITNSGSISTPYTGIYINASSTFSGGITNSGTITATGGVGINDFSSKVFAGGIANSGTINSGSTGIEISATTFSGGITNSGTIYSQSNAIYLNGVSVFSGGITNSGNISSTGQYGIYLSGPTFLGGITNSGAITSGSTGVYLTVNTFSGGIINSGKITATNDDTIEVIASTFSGGITNSGSIDSRFTGIYLSALTFSGGIVNSGRISSTSGYGIYVSGSSGTFLGGITNTGSISGTTGIYLNPSNVSVFTSGTITGTGGTAIRFGSAGGNTLTLGPGFAMNGNVLGAGGDTFQLGGTGTGTFDLSTIGAPRQYEGFTTFNVVGGTWVVSGIFGQSQPWNVLGGILAGTGTLSSVNVNNGGTLAPGLPGVAGGTLGISGNLVMASAAAYLVNVSPSTASRTNVSGTAALAGTLDANGTGGAFSQGAKYTVLTATGGRSGTFGTLTITGSFGSMMPVVSYDANDVYLTLAPASLTAKLPPGTPQNDVSVANAITAANVGTPPLAFQNLFQLPPQQLQNALTQLSGEVGTGAQASAIQWTDQFLSMLFDPVGTADGGGNGGAAMGFAPERSTIPSDVTLAYARVLKAPPSADPPSPAFDSSWNVWGAAFGGGTNTKGDPVGGGSHDLTASTGGVAAGVDYRITPDTVVGLALAGGGTSWSLSPGLGSGRSDVFQAAVYGSQRLGNAYVSGALAFGSFWMSTLRSLAPPLPGDTLRASFNAQDFSGRLEGGYRIALTPSFTLTPYAAAQAQSFRTPGYSETGTASASDPFALAYSSQTATATRTELGGRFSQLMAQADGTMVKLFGRVAWAHDWQGNPALTATFQGLPTATFTVNGATPPQNLALASAGAEWRLRNGWSLLAKFEGEFAPNSQTYTGTARVKYSW
jgi:outer membrane autotransporter protein